MITTSNTEHWLIEQERNSKASTAIRLENEEHSYSKILELSKKASNYFLGKGIKQSDHVSILSENNLEFVIAINAMWLIGAIPIPINYRLNTVEIDRLVKNSSSNYIVKIGDESLNNKSEIINYNLSHSEKYSDELLPTNFNQDNIAIMLFTSGSTGDAKCVQLTFNNLFASACSADTYIDHKKSDVWLASLPFYHIGGFSIITRTLFSGCSLAIVEKSSSKNSLSNLDGISPTLVSLVPTMLSDILAKNIKPWKNLRHAFIGGGPATENLICDAIKSGWPISTVYGSTETASMVTIASTDNLKKHGTSAGKPLSGVEIELERQSDQNKSGRIIISSKSNGKYFSNVESPNDNLGEKKYYSNDLGLIDEDGNLQVLGRLDDVIISGGENISLTEIRKSLSLINNLKETMLFGIRDKKWGQSYIIVSETDEATIRKYLVEHLSKFKHPKEIYFLEKIPRNELGKIQKNKIKEIINADFL